MKTDNELYEEKDLIDTFMGRDHSRPASGHKFIGYHNSWNLLIPVVEKIAEYRLAYPEETAKVCDCKIVIGLKHLYPKVVECIEFINQQSNG